MRTGTVDILLCALVLACALTISAPLSADSVTASPSDGMQFREAQPAKRGPASEREPATVVEGDGFTPESYDTQEVLDNPLPGIVIVPGTTPPAARPIPPNFTPIMHRYPTTTLIPPELSEEGVPVVAPNQVIPQYPWPDYQPDRFDSQTEGTICSSCLFNQTRGMPLVQQGREIEAAVARATVPGGGNEFAKRLQEGAIEAAKRCRKMANFRGGGQSCKIYKNPEMHFRKSKGLCATGVQEAFKAAGRELGRGHGNGQDENLKRAGMVPAAFDPNKLPGGSVLACNGPTKWGHIEIVVVTSKGREFCSDFCSPKPTCGRGSYKKPRAYSWAGT